MFRIRRGLLAPAVCSLCIPAAPGRAQNPATGPVSVVTRDVFDPADPAESAVFYRWVNFLHAKTRERVVRRELLFKEGEPYRPELLEETERNLRRFSFLRSAEVAPSKTGAGGVEVLTRDAWTTEPRLDFKRQGGVSRWKTGIYEGNLLGFGKSLSAFYDEEGGTANRTFAYKDPQFMGWRAELGGRFSESSKGREYGGFLRRPFYASIAPFSWGATGSHDFKTDEPVYAGGGEAGRYARLRRSVGADGGISLASSPERLRQVGFSYGYEESRYRALSGRAASLLPSDRRFGVARLSLLWQGLRFIKERRIQKFDRDEDFDLGSGLAASLAAGPRWLGSSEGQCWPSLRAATGLLWGPGHFSLLKAEYASQWSAGRERNRLWRLQGQHYRRFGERQTLAAALAYDQGYRLEADRALLLGESSGLRGYSNNQFSGSRRLLANLEERFFFFSDVLRLFSFGAAAFLDAGYAWPDAGPRLGDLRASAGAGLRLAFSRSSRNVPIRFDLARALRDNAQSSRWIFSVNASLEY